MALSPACHLLLPQLSIAIQSGALAPSAVLARINSCSTRNRFALALQELGKAVRTTFLLDWIVNDSMCRAVHAPPKSSATTSSRNT
jgi:TnpA family transposase